MIYSYRHFIPENVAPRGTVRIVIRRAETGQEVASIPASHLGGLTPPSGTPLCSFGLMGDLHLWSTDRVGWSPCTKFENALKFFEEEGCDFCVVCGDLTQTGFYRKENEGDANEPPRLEEAQMANYRRICDDHPSLPVYEIAGNHESYYGMSICHELHRWETYTGRRELSYAVPYRDLWLVFLGEPSQSEPIETQGRALLEGLLNDPKNSGKRFLVFIHSYLEGDCGDPHDYRENSIFTTEARGSFLELLQGRRNLVLFHAHSHMALELQTGCPNANYTRIHGFHSVHIPSLSRPRGICHERVTESERTPYMDQKSQCYKVEVYPHCLLLRGVELGTEGLPRTLPLGVYRVETP